MKHHTDDVPSEEEVMEAQLEIYNFGRTKAFKDMVSELTEIPEHERNEFIDRVVMNNDELLRRGINVPNGVIIQRSIFDDGRKALFCLAKYLKNGKQKVTMNF